ncbi:MAG TPA: tetratricopeptide repeat protein [Vicinamibacterales bacterium]|nr:tetratricopeptide repeat protein [Vicinamibacterales bacterium]HPW20607.1 tetratricopeptide repeat protein [Vicinamibacterales bacterium]
MSASGKRTAPAREHHGTAAREAGRARLAAFRHRAATAACALLLVAAAVGAYSTSFQGVFVFDDIWAIVENPNIRTLWPLTTALSAPAESPVSGRPVASLSLALNYALAPREVRDVMSPAGLAASDTRFLRNVWGYHAANWAMHVLAALALFGLVRRTLETARLRRFAGGHAAWLALAAALLWTVHPLLTDAVTYVAQRTEVLMGLFFFLTLYCAIRAGEPGASRASARRWAAGAVAACALGMGSKQTMVLAPVMVWLWDRTFAQESPAAPPGGPRRPADAAARRRLYAGLAATWVLLAALVAHERWPTSVGAGIGGWTPWTYALTQTGVIAHYLRLAVVPSPLVLDYDGWPMARSIADVWPAASALAALAAATVVAAVRRSPWGFAGACFFAALAPSSSLLPLPTEIAAARRMYVPLAGAAAAAVMGGYLIGRRALLRAMSDAPARRRAGAAAAAVITGAAALALAAASAERNLVFRSEEGLWRDTVEKRPDNPRARLNYGAILYAAGRFGDAEIQLREAVRLRESSAPAHANLGAVLCATGRLDEGVGHLERALALDPRFTSVYGNLGEAYGHLGRRAQAAFYFAKAVEIDPDAPFLLVRLGWLLATSPEDGVRRGAEAVRVSERAVRLTNRGDPAALDTLAAAYAEAGRYADAAATGHEALALAERRGWHELAAAITARVSAYAAHRPHREPW